MMGTIVPLDGFFTTRVTAPESCLETRKAKDIPEASHLLTEASHLLTEASHLLYGSTERSFYVGGRPIYAKGDPLLKPPGPPFLKTSPIR
jgi:hypothetical protein